MLSIFASATESGSGGCKALCIVWPDMDNGSGQQSGDKPVRLVYYRKTVARVIGKKNVRFLIQFTVVGLRTASVYLDHRSHLATTKAATAAGPTSKCKKPVSRPSISARFLEYPWPFELQMPGCSDGKNLTILPISLFWFLCIPGCQQTITICFSISNTIASKRVWFCLWKRTVENNLSLPKDLWLQHTGPRRTNNNVICCKLLH